MLGTGDGLERVREVLGVIFVLPVKTWKASSYRIYRMLLLGLSSSSLLYSLFYRNNSSIL